jgi:hypothetical protein
MARSHLATFATLLFAFAHLVARGDAAPKYDKAVFEQHRNGSQSEQAYAKNARELRRFLWEHWLRRNRGEAKVNWSTVEGDGGTSIYRVEPDENGIWRVALQLEGSETDFAQEKSRHRSKHAEAYEVIRVKIPKDMDERAEPRVAIPGDAPLPPTKYCLLLKDKDGKVLGEL